MTDKSDPPENPPPTNPANTASSGKRPRHQFGGSPRRAPNNLNDKNKRLESNPSDTEETARPYVDTPRRDPGKNAKGMGQSPAAPSPRRRYPEPTD